MCISPSHSQEPHNSPSNPSLEPIPLDHHDSPQSQALEPLNPAVQPDSDTQNSNLLPLNESGDEPEEEVDEDQEVQEPEQGKPGAVPSVFPPPPSSFDIRMMSSSSRASGKRKKGKGSVKKQQAVEKKLQTLSKNLNAVPFIPPKLPDLSKHEKLLKSLGLWDFIHMEFDRSLRTDLIAQFIASYDPNKRCGYVNAFRIGASRSDLGRALKLPVKKEKGGNFDGVDMDFEALTAESLGFIEGFVSNWVLLHEDTWMMPNEVLNWTKFIKDGHPEKVDWAGLFWFMVEKELAKGEQLVDCYYASHLQYLIKSKRAELMLSQPEEVVLQVDQDSGDANVDEVVLKEQDGIDLDADEEVAGGEEEEEEEKKQVDLDAVVLGKEQDGVPLDAVVLGEEQDGAPLDAVVLGEEQDGTPLDAVVLGEEQTGVPLAAVVFGEEQNGVPLDAEVKEEADADVKMGDMSEVKINDALEGPNVELTLGPEGGEKEEGKDAGFMGFEQAEEEEGDGEEEEEDGEYEGEEEEEEEQELEQRQWLMDGRNSAGEHFMQRCNAEGTAGFDHFEERNENADDLEGDEEDAEEEAEDEYDIGPSNDDTLGGDDGLTGNFLQSMETNHIAFGSQGHIPDDSSVDLVDHRNEFQHISAAGLSFYNDNGKREIEHEHDMMHHALNGNNKRLRIDEPVDIKSMDFGTCMGQMQQVMTRARMLYEGKEHVIEQQSLNAQVLMDGIRKRDAVIDQLHKSKCEEIQKRDTEMYRLQRELYIMGHVLDDYRKALKQTNKSFAEYRKKCQLPEKPIYRDAGPGGAVLSISEIEKRRLKEEEEQKLNRTILEQKAREVEESLAFQFGQFVDKVLWMEQRLTDVEKACDKLWELKSKP